MVSVKSKLRVAFILHYGLAVYSVALAQTPASQFAQPSPPVMIVPSTTCNPWIIQTLPTAISFRQRFCLGLAQLASPATFVESGALAGYSQWRNSPKIKPRDADDFSVRLNHAYERQTARVTAELFVGYLHHEDPRPRFSNKQGSWHRAGAALFSVLAWADQDGNTQIRLLPIAGALGSGLTSMALYQQQNSFAYGLQRSGIAYGGYFVRAAIHEFSPELWSLTPGFIRKHHDGLRRAFTL
jgi:hypothetical protein